MPYLHVALATGRSDEQKRSLIRGLTDATLRLLEVRPMDVHVYLWESDTKNIGIAGDEPNPATVNDITVILREGRHLEVKTAYMKALTQTMQECLEVVKEDVHVVLSEVLSSNVGEGGVPMGPPSQPSWFAKAGAGQRY
jgi:4-oxalocrotonate tautomerase